MTESYTADAAELDETNNLDKIVLYALDEAMEKLKQSGEVEPFTVILHEENLFVESHPGDDAVECFNAAAAAVKLLEHAMDAYVFVYDGYITTDTGTSDALIAERARPEDETAQAFAILYTSEEEGEGTLIFEEGVYDLGSAASLLRGAEVTSDDLDELS